MANSKRIWIGVMLLTVTLVGLNGLRTRKGSPSLESGRTFSTRTSASQAGDQGPAGPRNIRELGRGVPAVQTGGSGYTEVAPIRTWDAPDHRQFLMISYPPATIEVIDSKPDPVTGEWLAASYVGTAAYKLSGVAPSQEDAWAVAGWSERVADEFILERWELVVSPSQQPTGGGGPPPLFPAKHFRRTEIYRGIVQGEFRGLEFDYEARFIYVLLGSETTASLLKFDNVANASPQTLATEATQPDLVGMHHLQKYEHMSLGRILECSRLFPGYEAVVFVDTNNDGVFDGAPIIGPYRVLVDSGVVGIDVTDSLRGPSY